MCYLVLTEKAFSKRLAFTYLEELQTEFTSQYGTKVDTVSRPYSFIQFGKYFNQLMQDDTLFCLSFGFLHFEKIKSTIAALAFIIIKSTLIGVQAMNVEQISCLYGYIVVEPSSILPTW